MRGPEPNSEQTLKNGRKRIGWKTFEKKTEMEDLLKGIVRHTIGDTEVKKMIWLENKGKVCSESQETLGRYSERQ